MIHPALSALIANYRPQSSRDYENAIREVVQEIALLGLGRTPFFGHAAFYGGSALRIFHGLPRFSEDLDFSLRQPGPGFSLKPYLGAVADDGDQQSARLGISHGHCSRGRIPRAIGLGVPRGHRRPACGLWS